MKSFAELKRVMKAGTRLKCISHFQPKLVGTLRTVTRVQTNGYYYTIDGDGREFWSPYPKASGFTFSGDQFTVAIPDHPHAEPKGRAWTLEVIQ